MDQSEIERYRRGAHLPAAAIEGLTQEQLTAFPVPGTWSIQQIILHLMDSDLIGSDRMKRIIAEDQPRLIGYNESAFARDLFYHDLDVHAACDIFAKNRLMTAEILQRLPGDAFLRTGQHNEDGTITLKKMVSKYADHLEYHLNFVREKRRLLGCPAA